MILSVKLLYVLFCYIEDITLTSIPVQLSDLSDVRALEESGLYGANTGKAYYTGAIDLKEAVRIAGEQRIVSENGRTG